MQQRLLLLACLVGLGLGCRIAPVITDPVVTDPSPGGTRYSGCKRAAEDYCAQVVEPPEDQIERCVAEATYDCMSGRAR